MYIKKQKQNKPNSVPTGLFKIQLFKWGEFYILGTSYNLTSDDLRPWYWVSQKCRTCLRPYISKIIVRYVNFKTSLERKKTLGKLFWYQIQPNLQHLCTLRWPYCLTIIGCNFVLNDWSVASNIDIIQLDLSLPFHSCTFDDITITSSCSRGNPFFFDNS